MEAKYKVIFVVLLLFVIITRRQMAQNDSSEPIWFSSHANLDDIRRAIDSGARGGIDARNNLGQTGLMFAINMNRFDTKNIEGEDYGLVELLIKNGANPNALSEKSPREEDFSFNNTPLHYVAIQPNYQNTVPLLNYLIDAGAAINIKNNLGETPFMWTANLALKSDKDAITKEFIINLADVNAQNNIGDTYLHILIKNKDYMWVQEFIDTYGSMIDKAIKNNEGWTVADLAEHTLQPESQRALSGMKLVGIADDVKSVDTLGRTGLMLAIIRNDIDFAQRQLKKGSDVNAHDTTRYAHSPLHFAILRSTNIIPFLQLLLDYKVNPNNVTHYGDTPLHYLVKYNIKVPDRDIIVEKLLAAGADPYLKNRKGESVISIAKKQDPNFARQLKEWSKQSANKKQK